MQIFLGAALTLGVAGPSLAGLLQALDKAQSSVAAAADELRTLDVASNTSGVTAAENTSGVTAAESNLSRVFIIFSAERTGSTFFCESLDQQPDITMSYELLNRNSKEGSLLYDLGFTYNEVMADLPGFMRAYDAWCPTRLCGFKVFNHHVLPPATLDELFALGPTKSIIVDRQNRTAQYASVVHAKQDGIHNMGVTPCRTRDETATDSVSPSVPDTDFNSTYADMPKILIPYVTLDEMQVVMSDWFANVTAAALKHGQLRVEEYNEFTSTDNTTQTAAFTRILRYLGVEPAEGVPIIADDGCS